MEIGWDCDSSEAVLLDENTGFLGVAVFEDGAKPGVDEARYVYGSCGDEVVPAGQSVVAVPEEYDYEHRSTGEMCDLEELVSKAPGGRIS
jgi:hypothetical protein